MTFPSSTSATGGGRSSPARARGIGLELAEGLAAHGAEVVLNGRDAANFAAAAGRLAGPGIAPYTAAKGAVRNLTRGMATDWAKQGDDPAFTAWLVRDNLAAHFAGRPLVTPVV